MSMTPEEQKSFDDLKKKMTELTEGVTNLRAENRILKEREQTQLDPETLRQLMGSGRREEEFEGKASDNFDVDKATSREIMERMAAGFAKIEEGFTTKLEEANKKLIDLEAKQGARSELLGIALNDKEVRTDTEFYKRMRLHSSEHPNETPAQVYKAIKSIDRDLKLAEYEKQEDAKRERTDIISQMTSKEGVPKEKLDKILGPEVKGDAIAEKIAESLSIK